MPQPTGRRIKLSVARRIMGDLMYVSRGVPSIPMERRMQLRTLVAARQAAWPRPSWCAIFTKAYAHVAARWPELRRAYIPIPYPHLYEHPINIASIAVEREIEGELGVLFAHVRCPEQQSLQQIDDFLRRCKEAPLESIAMFRRVLRLSLLPMPVRRLLWWWGLNFSGYKRIRNAGTFGVSVTAGQGAAALHVVSPMTITIHYGALEPDGSLPFRLSFDHRVVDGALMARAMTELEHVLTGEIVDELLALRLQPAA